VQLSCIAVEGRIDQHQGNAALHHFKGNFAALQQFECGSCRENAGMPRRPKLVLA
jgi:hypothetical protein